MLLTISYTVHYTLTYIYIYIYTCLCVKNIHKCHSVLPDVINNEDIKY